jgi:hypothetical protein
MFIIGLWTIPGQGFEFFPTQELVGILEQQQEGPASVIYPLACTKPSIDWEIYIDRNEQDPEFADLAIREKISDEEFVELDSISKFLPTGQIIKGLHITVNCADKEFTVTNIASQDSISYQRKVTVSWAHEERFSFLKYNMLIVGEKIETCRIHLMKRTITINERQQGTKFALRLPALEQWQAIEDLLPYPDICAGLSR